MLYLFHGTSGRASDWVNSGDAEHATEGLPLIVVMPDAGFDGNGGGWFTNWVNTTTALGPSQWETFHVDQLIPWVDANLRTIAARRAGIAGLSQGGFGSTTYAARHPDLFVSAAAFSGAPDIDYNPAWLRARPPSSRRPPSGSTESNRTPCSVRATNEINWQGHDPATLVTNLRGVDLWLYTATGAPGPYDPAAPNPGAAGIESLTHGSTISFVQRAQQLGVPVHLDDYVYGTHSWPYWARDLREYLGPLMGTFAHPPPPPASVSYQSIDKTLVAVGLVGDRRAIRGAGVQRPQRRAARRLHVARHRHCKRDHARVLSAGLQVDGDDREHRHDRVADKAGRLQLTVPLGVDVPGAGGAAVMGVPSAPTTGASTTVSIAPA